MNYLLDTHTFLWFINDDKQLSGNAASAIANPAATKYISIASLWEIAIKLKIGKLELDMPFKELMRHIQLNGFELLPINFEHTIEVSTLELHHRDPFDRIIIAQALVEKLVIIGKDENFPKYSKLRLLW